MSTPDNTMPSVVMSGALAKKIAAVQKKADVDKLPQRHVTVTLRAKEGQSSGGSYSYDYITESVLMAAIRPLLAEEGVAVLYSDEILNINGNLAQVRVFLTLIDGETGDTFTMHADGVGTDFGDKAVNKAKTAAMRYLLWKWFLVPSDIDPEEENVQRSAEVPRDQLKWATVEDVEAFVAEVEAAGFKPEPTREAANAEFLQWEGYRQTWLDSQRAALKKAIEAAQ